MLAYIPNSMFIAWMAYCEPEEEEEEKARKKADSRTNLLG